MFQLGNVDLRRTFAWLREHPECFDKQGFARFSLEEADAQFEADAMTTFVIHTQTPSPHWMQVYNSPNPGEVTICCPSIKGDGTDVEDLTRAEVMMAGMLERWMERIRPTVQCMITGEAAGAAAGLCSKNNANPRELDGQALRLHLKGQGACL